MQAISRPQLETSATARHSNRFCGECSSGRLTRISRVSFTDYLLSEAGLFPYVCNVCRRRAFRADFGRVVFLSVCVLAMAAMAAYTLHLRHRYHPIPIAAEQGSAAVENSGDILSNEDISRMGRVNIPSVVMQRLISGRPNSFHIDSDSLIALKKDGVPDEVILSMVTVTLEHPNTRLDGKGSGAMIASVP